MPFDSGFAIAVAGMIICTYATRAGGLWLMTHVPLTPRVAALLRYISGTVLVAILTPSFVQADPLTRVALASAVVLMIVTRRMIIAMVGAAMIAALLRAAFAAP